MRRGGDVALKIKYRLLNTVIVDIILINLSFFLSIFIIYDFTMPQQCVDKYFDNIIGYIVIKLLIFTLFKFYNNLWEYASINELSQLGIGVAIANILVILFWQVYNVCFLKGTYVLITLFDMVLIGGFRLSYRIYKGFIRGEVFAKNGEKRVMVVGAGDAGAMVIKELKNHTKLNSKPVAVIDDDPRKERTRINGIPVVGQKYDIYSTAMKMNIDEIIIAIPSASKTVMREVVEECNKTKCKVKILPGIYELIDGKVSINKLRDVKIEDLLGREQIELDVDSISGYLEGKIVLVTGGGGSIGSELCRQIAKYNPRELIILDIYENNAYELQNELNLIYNCNQANKASCRLNLRVLIASVRDKEHIDDIINSYKPEVIFHAAAHKHVPLMEGNPKAAINNNIFGTLNMAQSADKHGVKKFVLISTDKAVNPVSVMGATKRVCEMIVQSINYTSDTDFVAVRFGNVLGSNGSVIPLFKNQIAQGGPVTVTDLEMIRYFMTIPEASQLVLEAGGMAEGGEIFVLDMGEPVKIIKLAEDLIRLSGLEPYEDIAIVFTGLRPGEKLYEELLLSDDVSSTKHEKILVEKPIFNDYKYLLDELEKLKTVLNEGSKDEIKEALMQIAMQTEVRPPKLQLYKKM